MEAMSKTPFLQLFYDSLDSTSIKNIDNINKSIENTDSLQNIENIDPDKSNYLKLKALLNQTASISMIGIYY